MRNTLLALVAASQLDGTAATIKSLAPKISISRAIKLGAMIDKAAAKHGVEAEVLTVILAQESSFKSGVVRCFGRKSASRKICHHTCDVGISQINIDAWGEALNLNPCLLRLDDAYAIETAAKILSKVKRLDPTDPRWWSKYHNHREVHRIKYENLIVGRLDRANIDLP